MIRGVAPYAVQKHEFLKCSRLDFILCPEAPRLSVSMLPTSIPKTYSSLE